MTPALTRRLLIGAAGFAAVVQIAVGAGVRINTSPSVPLGLYWETGVPLRVGAFVILCPPPTEAFAEALRRDYIGAGFCPGGYGYVFKRIQALAGDRISVTDQGVWINGQWMPGSRPLNADPSGRLLPRYRTQDYTLAPGEVLLLSDQHPRSFDGRYFGPVEASRMAVIQPVVTW